MPAADGEIRQGLPMSYLEFKTWYTSNLQSYQVPVGIRYLYTRPSHADNVLYQPNQRLDLARQPDYRSRIADMEFQRQLTPTSPIVYTNSEAFFFSTNNWQGTFAADSGVLQSLQPATDTGFDFSPADYFDRRNDVGNYHTGDLTVRWREQGQSVWNEIDTAAARDVKPVSLSATAEDVLLTSYFDFAQELNITRNWMVKDEDLVLQVTIANTAPTAKIELGAFGFPLEFNNIFTNRTADDTTAKCVLLDPYIGLDAGYVQATRLTGTGPNLVITPYGTHSRFEAWRFLHETKEQSTGYATQTFEGIYAWQMLSKAYAETEWNATEPWNRPTSVMLEPAESVSFGLRFSVSPTIHEIEDVVSSKGVPLAIGIPGYVLPTDWNGKLFLLSESSVSSIMVEPPDSLKFTEYMAKDPTWKAYQVNAKDGSYGRVRVSIHYEDGREQSVHYYITDTTTATSAKLANFLVTKQWYTNTSDPFHRAPGLISYDYEKQQHVLQDARAWIAGMSDEGGAGSFEAAAMKIAVHPDVETVAKLELMVQNTVWGNLQNKEDGGTNDTSKYAVKRSLFYHDPQALPDYTYDPTINFNTWAAWNKTEASQVWRSFNYVHVSVLYWALYHAELISPGVLTLQNSTWYLQQSFATIIASQRDFVEYRHLGQVGESIWLSILRALETEKNFEREFKILREVMRKRQMNWSEQSEPFGSEMSWDSTGQEGVYFWSKCVPPDPSLSHTQTHTHTTDTSTPPPSQPKLSPASAATRRLSRTGATTAMHVATGIFSTRVEFQGLKECCIIMARV